MSNAERDQNNVPTLLGVSNVDGSSIVPIYADPVTHRLLVDTSGGGFAPGGVSGNIQYNNAGSFGGITNFNTNGTDVQYGTTTSPDTGFMTFGTGFGIRLYNTADQALNYERVSLDWSSNVFDIGAYFNGTGTSRSVRFGVQPTAGGTSIAGGRVFSINTAASVGTGVFDQNMGTTGVAGSMFTLQGTLQGSSNTQNYQSIQPTINQSGTSSYSALIIQPFEQAVGSGAKYLINAGTNSAAQAGGTFSQKFFVDDTGILNIAGIAQLMAGFSSSTGTVANFFAVGGNSASSSQSAISAILFGGASSVRGRAWMDGNASTTLSANDSYASFIVGSSPITTPATGTNAVLASMVVNPLGTVTGGGAAITNTASLYIGGASAAGTNNYGVWNTASERIDGALTVNSTAAVSTSVTAPVVIGGTGTTSPLTLRSTSGAGTTGADIVLQTGNNGATEVGRYYDSGIVTTAKQSGCRVYLGTAVQSIPSAMWTVVAFDTKSYDIQNEFDATTNHRFTATQSGHYLVTSTIYIQSIAASKQFSIGIRVNGGFVAYNYNYATSSSNDASTDITEIVSLNAGDYVDINVYNGDSVSRNLFNNTAYTWVSIAKIA